MEILVSAHVTKANQRTERLTNGWNLTSSLLRRLQGTLVYIFFNYAFSRLTRVWDLNPPPSHLGCPPVSRLPLPAPPTSITGGQGLRLPRPPHPGFRHLHYLSAAPASSPSPGSLALQLGVWACDAFCWPLSIRSPPFVIQLRAGAWWGGE